MGSGVWLDQDMVTSWSLSAGLDLDAFYPMLHNSAPGLEISLPGRNSARRQLSGPEALLCGPPGQNKLKKPKGAPRLGGCCWVRSTPLFTPEPLATDLFLFV